MRSIYSTFGVTKKTAKPGDLMMAAQKRLASQSQRPIGTATQIKKKLKTPLTKRGLGMAGLI